MLSIFKNSNSWSWRNPILVFSPLFLQPHIYTGHTYRPHWLSLSRGSWIRDRSLPVSTTSICGCTFQDREYRIWRRESWLISHSEMELHNFILLISKLTQACCLEILHLLRLGAGQIKVLMRNCAKTLSLLQWNSVAMHWRMIMRQQGLLFRLLSFALRFQITFSW